MINSMKSQQSTRGQKVAAEIQKDIADIFLKEGSEFVHGALVTVTEVRMSPDLSFARIFVSIFPFEKKDEILSRLKEGAVKIRYALGKRIKNQLRIVPEIDITLDDSMEYVSHIEELLKK